MSPEPGYVAVPRELAQARADLQAAVARYMHAWGGEQDWVREWAAMKVALEACREAEATWCACERAERAAAA